MRFVVNEMSPKRNPTNNQPSDKKTKATVNKKNTVGSGDKNPTKTSSNKKQFNVAPMNKSEKNGEKKNQKTMDWFVTTTTSSFKETSNNTAITSFKQVSNTSIVNPSSPITVSTSSTNITTTTTATATSSSIEGGIEMELSMDSERAIFGHSTSTMVTSRNTINSKIEAVLVPVDVHRERDKSTESDDNNNHVDIVKKRRKVQKGGRPKKTNLNKTNSNDNELSECEDISKQPRPRGPQGKFISKQNKDANDASVNIVGENSCVLESNASVKGVRGRGRPPKSSLNKMAKSILEHDAEREKNR